MKDYVAWTIEIKAKRSLFALVSQLLDFVFSHSRAGALNK